MPCPIVGDDYLLTIMSRPRRLEAVVDNYLFCTSTQAGKNGHAGANADADAHAHADGQTQLRMILVYYTVKYHTPYTENPIHGVCGSHHLPPTLLSLRRFSSSSSTREWLSCSWCLFCWLTCYARCSISCMGSNATTIMPARRA